MSPSADGELHALADGLYAAAPGEFVARRNQLAAEAGERDLTTRIRALPKPSTAAWAVNLLVRREAEQIDQALALGEALREAAETMQGDELRALTRQRRQLTTALASSARLLAGQQEIRLSRAVVEQVEDVLNAAMLDPVAADLVRTGLLVRPFTVAELAGAEAADLVAVPSALGTRAAPAPVEEAPRLHAVPDDDRVRRARAEEEVHRARDEVEQARGQRDELARERADLDARGLQLAEEIDELRRRLAELETAAEDVEEAREELAAREADVDDEVSAAEEELAAAERRLAATDP